MSTCQRANKAEAETPSQSESSEEVQMEGPLMLTAAECCSSFK